MRKENYDTQLHIYLKQSTKDLLDKLSIELDVSSATIVRSSIDNTIAKLSKKREEGGLHLLGI